MRTKIPMLAAGALTVAALLTTSGIGLSRAQNDPEAVTIDRTPLGPGIDMLTGQGGNLAVCSGADGIFLVDDQFAPLSVKILAAIHEIQEAPLRFVLNTHWHGDHTGGNANLAGEGAVIVAQDNVRHRMSTEQISTIWDRTTPPSPPNALPILTFSAEVTFHINGQTIEVFHLPHAHTDGDAIVHFVEADVFHTGDIFFNGLYPFVDTDSGGSLAGVLAAVDLLLERSSATTKFIPGHGPLAARTDLVAYRDMLRTVESRLAAARAKGQTFEEFLSTHPTEEYDDHWGQAWLDGRKFLEILYTGSDPEADHHHDPRP